MKGTIIITALFCVMFSVQAQDTLTIMAYNVLNYPSSNPTKADTLKPIIKYVQPDIFMINELESEAGATTILNNALNVDGATNYRKADFFSGPNTNNMLYYNTDKLVLYSQHEIPTALRNISEYVLYYKTPLMNINADTVFIFCYSAHLKASTGRTNEQKRFQEAVVFKNYLNGRPQLENVILGGDFNVYSNTEPAYETLLNGGNTSLLDPISSPGNWHNNIAFTNIHTQSTRLAAISGGGASGGLDDRFDFILFNQHLQTGTHGLTYIPNSYKAVGNDGNHFNQSINYGTNNAVPSNVVDALYYMSDHLPVVLKASIPVNVGIAKNNNSHWKGRFAKNYFYFTSNQTEKELLVFVYDMRGKVMQKQSIEQAKSFKTNLKRLPKGVYFVKVVEANSNSNAAVYKFVK